MTKMAKKKNGKKRAETSTPLTPKRYMKERARNLPLDKCYVTEEWQDAGMAVVIVTRRRKDGDLCMGMFLVDTYCLGVKDAIYNVDISENEVKNIIREHDEQGNPLREADYPEVHNLVLGAIEFAADAGIEPHRDYEIVSGILEEDTDDIPLICYDYGCDGKYLLVDTFGKHRHLIPGLKKRLGDKFEFVLPLDDDEFFEDYDGGDDYDDDDYDDEEDYDAEYEKKLNETRKKFEAEGLDKYEYEETMMLRSDRNVEAD